MKIYISHSSSFDYQTELYDPLEKSDLYTQHDFYLPHKRQVSNTRNIIKTCDLIIAEVSYASTGQGIELGWANDANIPIIYVMKAGSSCSSSLQLLSGIFIEYDNPVDLLMQLSDAIKTTEMSKTIKTPLFQNLDCVSFQVDDLDAGIDFYATKLGLKLLWRTATSCGLGMPNDITELVLTTAKENTVVQFKVASVEAALPIFLQAGGIVEVEPFDIDIGKCAVVKDRWENEYCILDMAKGRYQVDKNQHVTGVGN